MSISTTGFVLTNDKPVWAVMTTIEQTINQLVRKYGSGQPIFQDSTNRFADTNMNPSCKSCWVNFIVGGEARILSVHFDCDCDYSEYGDKKIIWSLTQWGMAEEIIWSICEAMKPYGKVFYRANDAITEEFMEVTQ